MASILRQISGIGVPLFGSLGLVGLATRHSARSLPLLAPWTFPVVVGGTWFMWYFLDDDTKRDMGLMRRLPTPTPPSGGGGAPPKLDSTASSAVMNAYIGSSEHELTEKQKQINEEIGRGDFTTLRDVWEKKMSKTIIPGDDDDDDEEEEDEEEKAEEEEEEEEEADAPEENAEDGLQEEEEEADTPQKEEEAGEEEGESEEAPVEMVKAEAVAPAKRDLTSLEAKWEKELDKRVAPGDDDDDEEEDEAVGEEEEEEAVDKPAPKSKPSVADNRKLTSREASWERQLFKRVKPGDDDDDDDEEEEEEEAA